MQIEINPHTLDLAILKGLLPEKTEVLAICTLFMVATSQKTTHFALYVHEQKGKSIFCAEKQKTLVGKVVGHEKMHISAKNGVMIRKFAMVLAVTKLTWVESQGNSYMVPNSVKDSSQKHWYAMFGIFPR